MTVQSGSIILIKPYISEEWVRGREIQLVKQGFKFILIFFVSACLLTCMLVLAAMIPQSAIKENVQESATYLCEGDLFGEVLEQIESSKIGRYDVSAWDAPSGEGVCSCPWSVSRTHFNLHMVRSFVS